jgi:transcriptional regulator with XRE-family HTH domain
MARSATTGASLDRLAQRLHLLRLDAGLTGGDVARVAGWSQSKVSRTETGAQCPTDADVREWAQAVGASKRTTTALLALAKHARLDYDEAKNTLRKGFRQWPTSVREADCERMRIFQLVAVPGLVQIPEYARHVLARVYHVSPDTADIDREVAVRMERQHVLDTPGKTVQLLIPESVLYNVLCPRPVLAQQLGRLIAVVSLGSPEFGVIPFDADLPVFPSHAFEVYDSAVVLVETIGGDLRIRDPEAIGFYQETFDRLHEAALGGRAALAVIERALAACVGQSSDGRRAGVARPAQWH